MLTYFNIYFSLSEVWSSTSSMLSESDLQVDRIWSILTFLSPKTILIIIIIIDNRWRFYDDDDYQHENDENSLFTQELNLFFSFFQQKMTNDIIIKVKSFGQKKRLFQMYFTNEKKIWSLSHSNTVIWTIQSVLVILWSLVWEDYTCHHYSFFNG